MDDLQKLLAIEEVRKVQARYYRYMDTQDWKAMATIFAEDAVGDYSSESANDEGQIVTGNTALADYYARSLLGVRTVHHGHMPEIEIVDENHATAIWAMEDVVRFGPEARVKALQGYGHYHCTYSRIDGRWLIQTIRLSRLIVDIS